MVTRQMMTTVQKIEKEISKLPESQRKEFRAWFEEFDAEEWDMQFEKDVSYGKLDKVTNIAVSDFKSGKFKKL